MPGHDQDDARRAAEPSEHDVAIAEEVILGELAAGQVRDAAALIQVVQSRFAAEPLPALFAELDDVAEVDCRAAWSAAAAMVALANLQWTGQLIPCDALQVPHLPELILQIRSSHTTGVLRNLQPEYAYPIGRQLRLSPWLRAIPPDSVAALRWPIAGAGDKITRVLREAGESYRRGLDVGAAMLVGIASEAAWVELAEAVSARTSDEVLRSLLSSGRAHAAAVAERTAELLPQITRTQPRHELRRLAVEAAQIRDLRDHAAHEPASRFDERLFTRAAVGLLLQGAVSYFRRLYAVVQTVRAGIDPIDESANERWIREP